MKNSSINKKISIFSLCLIGFFALSESAQAVCWKNTEVRNVGTLPNTCAPGTVKSGLFCYAACKPGYKNLLGVCWQQCPTGFKDTGGHCFKIGSYSRGTTYASMDRCLNDKNNKKGCEKSWGGVYPKCNPGFVAHVATECSRACPAGMKDIGVSCQKDSYVEKPASSVGCPSGKEKDAGLCYTPCPTETGGIGPVCWSACPAGMTDCGAMCGESVSDCGKAIGTMVIAALKTAKKLYDNFVGVTESQKKTTEEEKKTAEEAKAKIPEVKKEVFRDIVKRIHEKAKAEGLTTEKGKKIISDEIMAEFDKNVPGLSGSPGAKKVIESLTNAVMDDPAKFDVDKFIKEVDVFKLKGLYDAMFFKICGK